MLYMYSTDKNYSVNFGMQRSSCYFYRYCYYNINKNSRRNVDSEKSQPQMGFEPTTIRDGGGSWVQIPSGARIFPSLRFS